MEIGFIGLGKMGFPMARREWADEVTARMAEHAAKKAA